MFKAFIALSFAAVLFAALLAADDYAIVGQVLSDPSGQFSTISPGVRLDLTGPFFQSLGTNGRSCGTCHVATDAWSITPEHIKRGLRYGLARIRYFGQRWIHLCRR